MKAIDITQVLEAESKDRTKRAAKSLFFTLFIVFDILALLYLFKIQNMDPPMPEEEGGVLVAMGDPDAGNSDDSPPIASDQPASASSSADENLITEETDEDAPTAKSNPDTKPQPKDPNAAPIIDKPIENKTPTVNQALIFPNNKGKTGEGTGKGTGGKDGNQGQPDGTGDDPLGRGLGTEGSGYSMGNGRKPVSKITASCNFNRNEKVVVKIKIDKDGYVKESTCVLKYKTLNGTTNSGSYCDCALAAAKTVKFSPKADAPATQEGAILFDFKVK